MRCSSSAARRRRRRADQVEAGGAGDQHPVRLLAHLDDAIAVYAVGDEVQVAHFGQRMADRLVDRALGQLAAMDMRNRQRERQRRQRRRDHVVAVADEEQNVGPRPDEGAGEAGDATADRRGERLRGVGTGPGGDALGDGKAVGFDGVRRPAECRLKMHAADDQPQRQVGRLRHRRQRRFQQAVLCAGAGDDGDGASGAAPAAVRRHHRSPDWGCSEY